MNKKILIVDDDPVIVRKFKDCLEAQGYTTVWAADGKQAIDVIEQAPPHLVLLELSLPCMSGLEVLRHLFPQKDSDHATKDPSPHTSGRDALDLPIIVMTANATIEKAVEAMKTGAYDFLTKPIDFDHLEIVVKKALVREVLKQQVTLLRTEVESRYNTIVGESPSIQSVVELAQRAADSDASVLLLGECGTGKELLARSIHQWSARRDMPFSIINCMALNETLLENELFGHEKGAFTGADSRQKGRIEEADGGTLFLDEIGDMPLTLQAKLLRLLQDKPSTRIGGKQKHKSNFRVIAATDKNLKKAVKEGTFLEELFHRLNVVSLSTPPLRERPEDIIPLAEHFLDLHIREMKRPQKRFTKETIKAMQRFSWPGNIRELSNAIARAVVLGRDEEIVPEQLGLGPWGVDPFQEGENLSYHDAIERYSRHILEQALRRSNWSQTKAADLLQLERTYLSRLLKQQEMCMEVRPTGGGDPWAGSGGTGFTGDRGAESRMVEEAAKANRDVSDDVRLTAFYPKAMPLNMWSSLLSYIHLSKCIGEVIGDSKVRLGKEAAGYDRRERKAKVRIKPRAEILIVPELSDCEINPPQAKVIWLENWHRVEFRVRPLSASTGLRSKRVRKGLISFYVGPVLVGVVQLSIKVQATKPKMKSKRLDQHTTVAPFNAVFVSYSHEDTFIVDELEKAYKLLPMEYLRDVQILRSGDKWNSVLLEKIEEADLFQLCWSKAAKESPYVEQEWRHALKQSREGFILPLYWEKPMPVPPSELSALHFTYFHPPFGEL
ncbi:MAG: hypothetical protein NPIRA04_29740 [Nitrospirales bacterium]|nr:MAG: hypothetical protein NPIRA04_29740 [Nitrospirales bacterium]